MSNNSYLPVTDSDRSAWLKNFAGKLPLYATSLGLAATDTTAVAADSAMFVYALDQVESFKKETAKRVAYKNQLADGEIGSNLGTFPVTGASAAAPTVVPAGVFKRTGKLVQRIKNHPNYTPAIGQDLGIESHDTINALDFGKPELKVTFDAGHPVLKWKKGNMSAIDLFVDRGDGKGFAFLATATVPHYTDTFDLPLGTNSAQWIYKAIYKSGNDQSGEFSNPVSIAKTRTI